MKKKGGYSLVETMVAIVVLALIVIPSCSSLILSHRMDAKAEKLLEGQLAINAARACIEAGVDELPEKITVDGNIIRYDLGGGKYLQQEVSP